MALPAEGCTLNLFSHILTTVSFWHPSTYTFLTPRRIHFEDAVLRTSTSLNATWMKSSDASAKGITRPAYSISQKVEKRVDEETL